MTTTEITALTVALIALAIALLQLIQQYASSAATRVKVNWAAIGPMSEKSRYSWSLWEWKLRIQYAEVKLKAPDAVLLMERNSSATSRLATRHPEFIFGWGMQIVHGPDGPRQAHNGKLVIRQRGEEDQGGLPDSVLSFRQRLALKRIERRMAIAHERSRPCKATWCNLMTDLGIDPTKMPPGELIDADTILTALDAPVMQIQMSDLILFGFLLDMEVTKFDLKERHIDMVGKHCNITTQHQQGVGILTRYSGLSSPVQPSAFTCTPPELLTLMRTASGALHIGDSAIAMSHLGYNTVDLLLAAAYNRAHSSRWEQIKVIDVMADLDSDYNSRWNGKWGKPTVPVVSFLLCLAGNMAVCNSFPHRSLSSWAHEQRNIASRAAMNRLLSTVGVVEAPSDLFKVMRQMDMDLVVMDGYKTANNWGSEHGGLRGWLCTHLAEFVLRMSKCWIVSSTTECVPLLSQVRLALLEGKLDAEWGRYYDLNLGHNDRGGGWWMNASSLFWMQIMMLDTWIARRVELIMGENLDTDLAVPADAINANRAVAAIESDMENTGWKRSRIAFTKHYLERLADGWNGKGSSFMSTGEKHDTGTGWGDMPIGSPDDWTDVDAALTLRAVVMAARLEFMKDSGSLLDLQRLDPMIQLA